MRTDPTETGGLFVGRRPGTAPVRFRAMPQFGGVFRRRADGAFANTLLAIMVIVSLLFWGPIPILCLWIGSQVDYLTGSVGFGILVAFLALCGALFGALAILTRVDATWVLVRRPRDSISAEASSAASSGPRRSSASRSSWSGSWSFTAPGRRSSGPVRVLAPRLGLLDYYRQFEALSEEEVNRGFATRRASASSANSRGSRRSISRRPHGRTSPPERRERDHLRRAQRLAALPGLRAPELRSELSHRHEVPPARIAIGNGAAQLLSSAAAAAMRPGQELLTPWPSYPLFPVMATRAHASAVTGAGHLRRGLVQASSERSASARGSSRSRAPTNPTGERLPLGELGACLRSCPRRWSSSSTRRSSSSRTRARPGHARAARGAPPPAFFRSFSKAWGLAGLRVGYALGGPGAEELLAQIEPDFGIGDIAQAGALEALRSCSELVATVPGGGAGARALARRAPRRGFEASDSRVNFVWVRHPNVSGDELTARLGRVGVLLA